MARNDASLILTDGRLGFARLFAFGRDAVVEGLMLFVPKG